MLKVIDDKKDKTIKRSELKPNMLIVGKKSERRLRLLRLGYYYNRYVWLAVSSLDDIVGCHCFSYSRDMTFSGAMQYANEYMTDLAVCETMEEYANFILERSHND